MTESALLAERAAASAWIAEVPGLIDEVKTLDATMGETRSGLDRAAVAAAAPGPIAPGRAVWQAAALGLAQWRYAVEHLPLELLGGAETLRDPGGLATRAALRTLRDQLAILGPAGAELARIVVASEGLLPDQVLDEFRSRPIRAEPIPIGRVQQIVRQSLGEVILDLHAATAVLPTSQLHRATGRAGTDVLLRVRRPGVDGDLRADTRLLGTVVTALEAVVAPVRAMHPLAFVQLAARLGREETDFRHEALNLVEVGLIAEESAAAGDVAAFVARPLPGLISDRALVLEDIGGRPLGAGTDGIDAQAALSALAAVSVESALTHGVFLADLDPGHLIVTPGGGIGVVGAPVLGRFDRPLRKGVLAYLMAVFAGDFAGQVDALDGLDALGPTTDRRRLEADLSAEESLQPMTMLMGGEDSLLAGLKRGVGLLLEHGVQPPLPVALFVRNLFALRRINGLLPEGASLVAALMPMVGRLPELAASLA